MYGDNAMLYALSISHYVIIMIRDMFSQLTGLFK